MKGKTFSVYKVIFVVTALMAMIIGAGISFMPTKTKSYAAEAVVNKTEDYSQVDANGNILSVEKVYVVSGNNVNDQSGSYASSSIVQNFLSEQTGAGWNSMKTSQNKTGSTEKESYYYKNLQQDSKYVVYNNTYVMLDNKIEASNIVSNSNNGLQEAILVSFGQYDLGKGISDEGQEISQMNVMATLNGKPFVDETSKKSRLPGVRQFGGEGNNLYQDFVFVIPQVPEYAGHWYFDIEYYYAENYYTQHFEFYLLFNSSYTQKDYVNQTDYYTASPTLSEVDKEFNFGKETQYPTLTYDYTKYNMTYIHTANGVETKYVYKYNDATKSLIITENGKTLSEKKLGQINKNASGANYVVLMFTESGNYQFEYEYIYGGYVRNASSRPSMNLEKIKDSLKINGFQLKYSKYGYEEAQMKYLTLIESGTGENSPKADLIVPNGHNLNNVAPNVKKMGVVYDLISSDTSKVGTVYSFEDANINLENKSFDVATALSSDDNKSALLGLVAGGYVKTNQGSIWLSSANDYVKGENNSFYFFSKTGELKIEDLVDANKNGLDNTTEFNKTGYYLLIVAVDTDDTESTTEFYQVFAFQYTTDTVNINVVDADDESKVIGAGKYTNNAVKVWWDEPGIFDRKIEANYYYAKSNDKQTILNGNKKSLANESKIGYEVTNSQNTWATYIVEIKSEGDAATYRSFTIDTQNISGLAVYAVDQKVSNGAVYYEFSTDGRNLMKINAISNSYSTLYWNNKESGAEIVAKYDFTPFVQDSSIIIETKKNDSDGVWFSTNYKLGTKATGLEISKVSSLFEGVQMDSTQVFSQQGIYEFTLTDAAGNVCKYMFVVDKTESYFYVESKTGENEYGDGKFVVNSNEIYSDDVKYTVGTHKVIALDSSVGNAVKAAINDALKGYDKYYNGDGNNIAAIQNIFKNNYIIVKNMAVESKTSEDRVDSQTSINSTSGILFGNNSKIIKRNTADLGSSVVRKLYIIGENQYKTQKSTEKSFIQVEINADNSRGYVYTRNDRKFASAPESEGNGVLRLFTGTDVYGGLGIDGAHATSDQYVIFSWLVGADSTKVQSVEYTFYEFDETLNKDNYSNDLFFYKNLGKTTTVFANDVYSEGAKVDDNGKRAFAVINESNGVTREGFYKITRTYAQEVSEGSKDFTTFTYYFIVDRTGIIDKSAGREITLWLLENETEFKDFNQHNARPGTLEFADKDDINYNVYLTTNKVPATLEIPVGKYFNGEQGSNYYAGRLTFSVYFNDTEKLLSTVQDEYLLFEIDSTASSDISNWSNGIFKIDFSSAYEKYGGLEIFKTLNDANSANWMYLPGDYVIVINDLVEGSKGHNQKVIAFSVQQEKPVADIYVTTEEEGTTRYDQISGTNTTLTTNQKYVKLEIPAYDKDNTNAQIDQNYLVITQQNGGSSIEYINYPYQNQGNPKYNLETQNDAVSYKDGKLTILLETTDASGSLITDRLITYTITVRYKLWTGDKNDNRGEKFKNCYVVDWGSNIVYYYEQTYTIVIDRIAPTANIDNFTKTDGEYYDALIVEYNNKTGVHSMFEPATYNNSEILYFTNRYTAFYNGTQQTSELYALKVNDTTKYKTNDISKVYSRTISQDSLATLKLSLPVTAAMGSTTIVNISDKIKTYKDILPKNAGAGIYEIVEFDKAGNMTQYLIEYRVNSAIKMTATFDTINKEETKEVSKEPLTFFDLKNIEVSTEQKFYQIVVKDINQNTVAKIYSDLTTTLAQIGTKVKYAIITNGVEDDNAQRFYGQYFVQIVTRDGSTNYVFNYNDRNTLRNLSLEKLVNKSTDPWRLTFAAANEQVNNELYYLKEISIRYIDKDGSEVTRKYKSTDGINYVKTSGDIDTLDILDDKAVVGFKTVSGTIYVVQAIDSTDREVSTLKFKSGDDSYVYYGINFGVNGDANAVQEGTKFYSFQQATIQYDLTSFSKVQVDYSIGGKSYTATSDKEFNAKTIIEFKDNYVMLYPYFSNDGKGAKIEYVVNLYATTFGGTEVVEHTYTVIIDTTTNSVGLKDVSTGNDEGLQFNANVDVMSTPSPKISSGSKMIIWSESAHDKFNYSYVLYEKLKETDSTGKNYRVRDLNDEPGYYQISTGVDSLGEYRFVIEVADKYGNYLGRKIYTFAVKAELNRVYYVQTKDGENVVANSSFTYDEIESIEFNKVVPQIYEPIDLYITNQDLSVVVINNTDITENIYYAIDPNFNSGDEARSRYFEIHEIDAKTYKLYFAILKIVNNSGDLIERIAITDEKDQTTSIWSKAQYPASVEGVSVVGSEFHLKVDSIDQGYFLNKNTIMVNVKYGEQYVDSFELYRTEDTFKLEGNGTYVFEVRDLAGNVQIFQTQYGAEFDYVQATVLREVEVKINGEAPLAKAFYNGVVEFSVANRMNYEQGTISWVATRNGVEYATSNKVFSYNFAEYGSYRIIVTARPKDSQQDLIKTVSFTIVNPKEAKKAFDLTNIANYKIVEVLDNDGTNITNDFLEMLEYNKDGKIVTYDMILNNPNFDIGSGKQTYTISYVADDGLYPRRDITFQFTLNNETPYIDCSLAPGEDTTKEFSISFNPGIIYKQIGEAVICVNGQAVISINENSKLELIQKSFSEKINGAGDYYITIQSLSGDIITAFKVTIKEPLNASAIIIIVVVSAVVIAVVVTFIVLRTRMRIR